MIKFKKETKLTEKKFSKTVGDSAESRNSELAKLKQQRNSEFAEGNYTAAHKTQGQIFKISEALNPEK